MGPVDVNADVQPSPRLTRLELHGFKSFSSKTVFTFQPGITAVVGPNGSGKSNVADGVRWVLGEQSHGLLRSKKTEDVIFAGGRGRGPAGMAEVAVTFDNSTGWLPIAFSEVTVTRRAYRSGENQYLINGRKVRLKDVHALTASLGQSHTVVGQGLIDSALSQRPEERRGLFEHAADLTGLRIKAAEAERSLTETESNSLRLSDLLLELEPRLKTLERAAKQAHEYQGLVSRLRDLQRTHYGRLLRAAHARVEAAERAAAGTTIAVDTANQNLTDLQTATETTRAAATAARDALATHDTGLNATTEQARRIAHERDLAAERHSALSRRREDMADTQAGLDEQVATVTRELAAVATGLDGLEAEVTAARTVVKTLQADVATARGARHRAEERAQALAKTIADHERRTADLGRRRALLTQRGETDAAELERITAQMAERAGRIAGLERELAAFDAAATEDDTQIAALEKRISALNDEIAQANAAVQAARTAVAEAERGVDAARTRLEVLQRLHDSGAGLYAGVKATLQAARAGKLDGIRGTVAELIDTPARYETAVEVALGGHLQDVVVSRWADAEAAIAHLKRSNSGRATFQPLDSVRGGPTNASSRGQLADALGQPGVHGVAADLIGSSPEVEVVVRALLGRTLVVDDLPAARKVLPALPGGWSAVTLAGEIARTGGSVTGGAAVRESGTLSRERELRDLPKEIIRLSGIRDAALAAQDDAIAVPRQLGDTRQEVEGERSGRLAAKKERAGQRARLARWLDDLRAEQAAAERRRAALDAAGAERADATTRLDEEERSLSAAIVATRQEHEAAQAELGRESGTAADGDKALAEEGRTLAALEERLRAERRRETNLRTQERALAEELGLRAERSATLDGERAAVAAQHERLAREAADLEAERARLMASRAPLEAAARQAEAEIARLDRSLTAARDALFSAERAAGSQGLDVERAHDELETIRIRILEDLELEDPDELLNEGDSAAALRGGRAFGPGGRGGEGENESAVPSPSPPQSDSFVPLKALALSPSEVEREISRLKDRLRRVGYVGEDAVAEFERESERQGFLRTQLDDVQKAAAALRELLADLHGTMQERFDATFSKVAAAFTEAFTTLFGGGTAKLTVAEGDERRRRRDRHRRPAAGEAPSRVGPALRRRAGADSRRPPDRHPEGQPDPVLPPG